MVFIEKVDHRWFYREGGSQMVFIEKVDHRWFYREGGSQFTNGFIEKVTVSGERSCKSAELGLNKVLSCTFHRSSIYINTNIYK